MAGWCGGWQGDVVGWRGEAGPTGPSQGVTKLNNIMIIIAISVRAQWTLWKKKRKNYLP